MPPDFEIWIVSAVMAIAGRQWATKQKLEVHSD